MLNGTFFAGSALAALAGYLLGSLSFAIIISTLVYGKDVRQFGSGNAGMTNMLRTFGKQGAAMVFAGDFLKGVAAVWVGGIIFRMMGITVVDGGYISGFFAIVGHLFPLYFGFRGGKGVLTSAGVILMINPPVLACLVVVALPILLITRIVSVMSISVAVLYPVITYFVLAWQHKPALFETLFAVPIGLLVVYMHRSNIQRLLNGTENRFGQKKEEH